jgi:arylsulfatase A-like enzyme
MLTGLFPMGHGVMMSHLKLPDAIPTLASTLASAGYDTAAVVNSTWLQKGRWGVARGFEKFLFVEEAVDRRAPSTWVTDQAMDWLRELGDGRLFLFVHYYDVHSDYASLPAYERLFVTPYTGEADGSAWQLYSANLADGIIERCRRDFDPNLCELHGLYEGHVIDQSFEKMRFREDDVRHIRELYDAEIRQLDTELGRFFAFLRQHQLMDEALLIVTADHGEEFMEHGSVEHAHAQYQESLRVPLLIRGPGLPRGLRISTPVSLVDIAPTVLGLTRVEPSQPLAGLDLAPLWNHAESPAFDDRYLYGEASHGLVFEATEKGLVPFSRSLRRGRYKLYYDSRDDAYRLYDLEADPGETTDISAREPDLTAQLTERMSQRYRDFHPESRAAQIELDPADAERLRALGYVQ